MHIFLFLFLEASRRQRTPSVGQQQNAENALFSPGGVGLRESGDIEGVRQENDRYISGDITDADAESWRNRTIIPKNVLYNQRLTNIFLRFTVFMSFTKIDNKYN